MPKEKDYQNLFNKYIRETKFYGFFELKKARLNSFPVVLVEQHQIDSLLALDSNGLVWKLSDADMRQKPCDSMSIPPLRSYVVVFFSDLFCFVDIHSFLAIKVKTVPKERLIAISTKVVYF